jgi:hypothetical protein
LRARRSSAALSSRSASASRLSALAN